MDNQEKILAFTEAIFELSAASDATVETLNGILNLPDLDGIITEEMLRSLLDAVRGLLIRQNTSLRENFETLMTVYDMLEEPSDRL